MKELKKLNKEKKKQILLNCEPFFLDIIKKNQVKNIHKLITEVIGTDKYSRELWCILTAVGKALRYHNTASYLTLNQRDYTTANKIHNKGISRLRMVKLIPLLEDSGYITFYKGYKNRIESYKSCFVIHDKMLSLFSEYDYKSVGTQRKYTDCIEIKTESGDIVTSLRGYSGEVNKESIIAYNQCLEDNIITLKGRILTPVFKRVYSHNLYRGGRFYTMGSFQSLPKKDRQYLKINGEKCVELDYKSIHANILYSMENVTLTNTFDPYYIDCSLTRTEIKFLFMCCLYNDKKSSAIKAYISKKGGIYQSINTIVYKLLSHNEKIAHYFFNKDLWATLQYKDSKMAEFIIDNFVSLDKPILCWHDSHVVMEEDEELLESLMFSAWDCVLGNTDNCKVTKEF